MSKTGHIKNSFPGRKFNDHALVIDARDFGELYFFLSSLDNVLNPFYLPALPCHEEAFRERSTRAAGERPRSRGLTRPELRAKIANVARRRRGKPSAWPWFPAQAGERETASAASHPQPKSAIADFGLSWLSASREHPICAGAPRPVRVEDAQTGTNRARQPCQIRESPAKFGTRSLEQCRAGSAGKASCTTQRAGPALPASSSFGRRRLKLNSGRDGAAGILAFARLIQRGPSPATREQGKLPAPVARLVRAAPTGQHRPVSVNQTPRASPARAPPHRRWSSSMA